jgi:hypothetical protein
VTYQQAEDDAKRLAACLIASFGQDRLAEFCYAAIPRGGLIVLGMLSYILGLDWDSLSPHSSHSPNIPLVIVDDCSLSGARFKRFLSSIGDREAIFAHLYSHPDLRASIVAHEPNVLACFAARDLRDLAPARYPNRADYLAWQNRWRKRLPGKRYWIGIPEFVVLPWNEPDRPVWNPATGQIEDNWRLAPPNRCLKNWARLAMPAYADTQPTLRIPENVAYNLLEDQVVLYDKRNDQVYGLEGVSAAMWRALAAYGDLRIAAHHLSNQYDVDKARLQSDLNSFTNQLLDRNLLEHIDDSTDGES